MQTADELRRAIDLLCHEARVEWEKATTEAKRRESEIAALRLALEQATT
jgi:hypothetical protein